MNVSAATARISADQNHLAWDPAVEPVASVGSGDVVEFECLDASNGEITASSTTESLATLDFDRVDQVTGPVEVAGAEPGDTLQVELLELEPADWGWTASIPGFGLLADDFPDGFLKITRLPPVNERVEFWPGIRLPLAPFCGELGVAPETGPLSTIPPDRHGGNMDTRHLVAGSTLFLPVFHAGARFSIGDGHATQGDGEVSGTAIETPMRALVRLTVRKDLHLSGPEFRQPPTRTPSCGTGRATPPTVSAPTSWSPRAMRCGG
jgi:acetamidase/formamidase